MSIVVKFVSPGGALLRTFRLLSEQQCLRPPEGGWQCGSSILCDHGSLLALLSLPSEPLPWLWLWEGQRLPSSLWAPSLYVPTTFYSLLAIFPLDSRVSLTLSCEFGDYMLNLMWLYVKYKCDHFKTMLFIFWRTVTIITFITSWAFKKSLSQVSSVPELFLCSCNLPLCCSVLVFCKQCITPWYFLIH